MACSKFFSGDLPELLNEVIQYFHYDYKTLHSCILVNRLWCRLAIPLLWEDPFSIKLPKNHHFIEIYLHNLSDDDKTRLNEYVIHNNLFPNTNTFFNYPKFIQRLNTHNVYYSIKKWASTIEEEHSSYSPSQIPNFTKLIFKSLFLIFIKNEVNLHSFKVMVDYEEFEYFDAAVELILQNPNFVHNIKNLTLEFDEITDNVRKFLGFLSSNCNSISSFYFIFSFKYHEYPKIEENLSQMIKFQENLKKILFHHSIPPLYLLLSLKNSNCSNTLNTIIFRNTNFKNINFLSEVFNQLNVLESIHIIYCLSLDSKFIQQINNITKPFKLKSLFLCQMDELLLESLIQKSGNYLENFGINNCEIRQLIQSLKLYCNNIKLLYFSMGPNNQNINLILDLIKNMRQKLNYLMIDSFDFTNINKNIEISSIILKNLGQILPFKLEYLNLCLTINESDLEIFLKNSQNTFIKKLLIKVKYDKNYGSQDILPYIKEYIMKKKRVKYLAILESFQFRGEDLFILKDKAKEFQLHDIQVLNYHDLVINIYDFINKTY
ncbi:uncharacterized protein OCT59_009783 [Rhizophagus irregularis]|uniref:F-box domain-containing protein n=2 Tax=Rhizophagus irregularis TaxID=588596 RepID=A0A015M5I1_RHIIW|nr:hypothetical protein GLOIN_2v1785664 [Rhizophagus irregularis DAOM 181602=DAOM 197198]EXX62083.1 hypothetical protein RirG_165170 [Rhizophagus irregularis DAOM 197198w]POG62149.1 hypothetical protein GLOIN_2v1785664 [Rhizophagus irregularis DAOM 181602=DAOM 197198]UZO18470.1 hypothetical protein OCT59_009783 [Rhizophagus irregularis]GBC29163.1 hypothetical protein GLOIN_2v1785664 [Rhizophagus irregularis DAOM 181602=DAOM 197198]|eukprot:XP_025169015.1 hypothetical protein GLOIN_2v1785664 [Rhizophagus irregularis DAOM 181602=DAOM 197198]